MRAAGAICAIAAAALLASCGAQSGNVGSDTVKESERVSKATYEQITQDEAKRIMSEESGYVILDVRREDEFAAGHIPGAICVPNETIGEGEIPELPDRDQTILVYCRSGRRSKEAAAKLAALGYTRVLEFGGIIDWTGETTKG